MAALTDYATNIETVPKKSKTSAASRKPAKPASRRKSTSAKKPKPVANARALARSAKSATPPPTEEEVRLRAYFIAERRNGLALPGDASSDWLEARRQLLSEVGPR